MSVNDGGPAFPHIGQQNEPNFYQACPEEGMSLRDYFAAKAMQGWLASWPVGNAKSPNGEPTAELAYRIADAMLAEREKGKGK